ncbi:hypothetical protein KIW84_015837 [Lathyrus oleraceus]|uniref:Uncharacterized protein n=1 Tax=Pisum sativum TaxID=3888 RepID=A0A9D5BRW2_PEA|nr:hypothetical protein KIW84_015837 [Pisum sativum]
MNFHALKLYGKDLVEQAGKLDPVIGRDEEIRRVVRILSRRTKNNPVVIEGLAQRIVKRDVPSNLADVKLVALDMGALVVGAKYMGEFEERLKAVLKEVEDAEGKVILFINEVHLVLRAGRTDGAMDAANIIRPMLARGQLRCIGATTLDEYRKYVETDAAFERRFQQVYVSEPSVPDTISIFCGLKEKYEGHHGVRIQDGAIIIDAQLSSRKRMQLEVELHTLEKENDKARKARHADTAKYRVVGQDKAVNVVMDVILKSRAGLGISQQPSGSFLFLGPTGVGKTKPTRFFDDEKQLLLINMSEYMEQHSIKIGWCTTRMKFNFVLRDYNVK